MGKTEQGFNFLGYDLNRERVTVIQATVERCMNAYDGLMSKNAEDYHGLRRLGCMSPGRRDRRKENTP